MKIFYIEQDDWCQIRADEQILEARECNNNEVYYEIEVKKKVKAKIAPVFEKLKMDLE